MSGSEGLAGDLHDLAGGWGVAAAVQYSIDHLPGSRTGDVGYDFSIAVGLLVGDLAELDLPGDRQAVRDGAVAAAFSALLVRLGSGPDGKADQGIGVTPSADSAPSASSRRTGRVP